MQNLYIEYVSLNNYRNFKQYEVHVDFKPIIIIGKNGSGKTNILEAISLAFPGRGLRYAKFEEICKYQENFWNVKYTIQSKLGYAKIENSFNSDSNKRTIFFNREKISGNELSKFTSVIWLTPQMDGIFLESPKIRRKFFDRIVYSFNEKHANNIAKYEHYLQERSKILKDCSQDLAWLKLTEETLARLAFEIAKARIMILNLLQTTIDNLDNPFPKADLSLEGKIEYLINKHSEKEILDTITNNLQNNRNQDRLSGKTNFGVHKTDFIVNYNHTGILAKLCSTGEQKALLISIVLAQINLIINLSSIKPIILFDEVFVHLDDVRKKYLIDFVKTIEAQIWVTATDTNGIEDLLDSSSLITI